ncbi:MotA/TolQ/ExbB proton channel family protein [Sphingomonas sp.]|uniref:MotA/TolQ/ExbB proton channel family protein n=1 Tax=Sphingomonas sp. TaxID=28214 RepID=UPI0035BC6BD0
MIAFAHFLDPTAFAIVGGGTALVTLLRAPATDVGRALAALRTLGRKRFDGDTLVAQVAVLARTAQRQGVVALDKAVITDADVRAAVEHIIDGRGGEAVAAMLDHHRRARVERHLAAAEVWAGAAEAAPAMGMVGTLIGLAAMFATMTDPGAIGGAMAVALLATLYGALIANLVAMPIAARLRAAARCEAFERARLVSPLAALAARETPRRLAA